MSQEVNTPREITEDLALRILSGRKVVVEAGVFEEPITVGTVTFGKKDPITGEVAELFYWKDENGNDDLTRPYAIVNLQAMNESQAAAAMELFDNGDFVESVGSDSTLGVGNLSLRMNVDQVEKFNIARGSIVSATFDYRLNSEDEEVLVCTAISPMKSKAGKNSFRERLNAQKAALKQEQTSKAESAEQEKA
mgnify:FL=1